MIMPNNQLKKKEQEITISPEHKANISGKTEVEEKIKDFVLFSSYVFIIYHMFTHIIFVQESLVRPLHSREVNISGTSASTIF